MEIDERQWENYQRNLEVLVHNRTEQLKEALDKIERLYSLLEKIRPQLGPSARREIEELLRAAKSRS